jgi:hypothetical protein
MDYAGLLVTTLIGAWFGSFVGSYLKKKAENIAIHEDINKLVEQVAAVTRTTKEIEAKISNEVWDRQRRWEVKKEALVELTKALADFTNASISLDSSMRAKELDPTGMLLGKALEAHSQAARKLEQAEAIARLVGGDRISKEFNELNLERRNFNGDVLAGKFKEARDRLEPIVLKTRVLHQVMRIELGLE